MRQRVLDPSSRCSAKSPVSDAVDRHARAVGRHSDLGEMAQMALVESLTGAVAPQLPTLFEPEPDEVRRALGRLSSGDQFAAFARSFFARLTGRTLDYYLSRQLANHIGPGERFASSAERLAFDEALATHAFEASRIVEDFAGGWYGKTIWQGEGSTPDEIQRFARFAFQKIRLSSADAGKPPDHRIHCGVAGGYADRSELLGFTLNGVLHGVWLRIG
jgi:hypothetical protein